MLKDEGKQPAGHAAEGGSFAALSRLAGRVLLIERAWPPLVWALAVALLFLAVSWLGLWLFAPRALRFAGVALFALAALGALAPLTRLRWPAGRDISGRLDRDALASHRPATSLADSLANEHGDAGTRALWSLHQARLARSVEAIRVAAPAPRMAERDPYALRFGLALLAFAAAATAGPELYGRYAAAFDWRGGDAAATAAASRIDAWIDPPPYAGRPPVVIDFKTADEQKLTVPEDSTLVVHGQPGVVETRVEGAITAVDQKDGAQPNAPTERRWTIHGGGRAVILRGGAKAAAVALAVTPAGAPTIKLTEEPHANLSGSLTLAYRIEDRYGLTGARAEFARTREGAGPAPRTLAAPPQAALQLPATADGVGEARTTADLSEHPWAGAKVTMTLRATSLSGKSGTSAPVELTLPQRNFHNPLARALVEQRRDLILDPDHAPKRVEAALTGLSVAPELFKTPASVYLGLNQARTSLEQAHNDADLLDVAALLWAMAQQIEDGDAPQAERDLRAAEQALREALKRGASDEEIRKLMQNLREAANRFMSQMARNAEQNPDAADMPSQDLDQMMDRMEESARNGAREDAEAMLDQMQNMFENMRSAREAEESPEERAMRKQIGELEKLLHDQQALRDDTFRGDQRDHAQGRARNRTAPGQDGEPQPDEDGPRSGLDQGENESDPSANPDRQGANPGDPALERRQRELGDRLAELRRRLKSLGMKGEKGFDDAQGDMKEAEGDLKGDQGGSGQRGKAGKGAAVDAQGRAIEALRQGAQGLQQQMGEGQGQGHGKGKGRNGGYFARWGHNGERPGDDPLGRGREGDKGRDYGPLRETAGPAERARRVLEELRRRLADPARPREERDYLERLMNRD